MAASHLIALATRSVGPLASSRRGSVNPRQSLKHGSRATIFQFADPPRFHGFGCRLAPSVQGPKGRQVPSIQGPQGRQVPSIPWNLRFKSAIDLGSLRAKVDDWPRRQGISTNLIPWQPASLDSLDPWEPGNIAARVSLVPWYGRCLELKSSRSPWKLGACLRHEHVAPMPQGPDLSSQPLSLIDLAPKMT